MEIFPAIDIMCGQVVRLTKGEFKTAEIFSENPLEILEQFKECGAKNLHIVDLDGAKYGALVNFSIIKKLASYNGIFIEIGGGIRDEEKIKKYLDLGIGRVILGTAAANNFGFVEKMAVKYQDKIAIGVDAKNSFVATEGWEKVTQIPSLDFCKQCADAGISTIIYTDIATDGAMQGTNMEAFKKLSIIKNLNIIASGGISNESELITLKKMGIYGAIIGKALYKGLIDLKRALAIAKGDI